LPRCAAWTGRPSLFDLARDEACHAIPITGNAVSSYLAFSPLPPCGGGMFSVALSVQKGGVLPSAPDVIRHRALPSPDFPQAMPAAARPA